MTKNNFKPIYAEKNANWRICYFPSGFWQLQEFVKLPDGVDRSRNQDWKGRNSHMSYNDAVQALAGKNTPSKAL